MSDDSTTRIERARGFLRAGAASGALGPSGRPRRAGAGPAFDWRRPRSADLQEKMRSGALTSRALTEAYLDRIAGPRPPGPHAAQRHRDEPRGAVGIAEALDRERREKGAAGAAARHPGAAQGQRRHGRRDDHDGRVARARRLDPVRARLLRRPAAARGGSGLLGKANLSEWANIRSNHSTSGWSGRGGQCRNPYALDRNPCGSSSGSARRRLGQPVRGRDRAPRPTARSSARRTSTASSASSPRSGW